MKYCDSLNESYQTIQHNIECMIILLCRFDQKLSRRKSWLKKKKSSKEKYYLVTLEGIKIYTTKAVKMSGETRYFTPLFYIQSNYSSPKSKFQREF